MIGVGISIGVFVGLICGIIVLAILRALSTASIGDAKSVKTLCVQLLSIISLVAGASFLINLPHFEQSEAKLITTYYFYSLGITFAPIILYPILRWSYRMGKEIGESKG